MDEAGSGDPWTGPYARSATSAIVPPPQKKKMNC